jgi:ammonia channel protein AmtB
VDHDYDPVAGFARAVETMAETNRLALRLHRLTIVLIGVAMVGLGWLVWQHTSQSAEHAALTQALLTETQALSAQTRLVLEVLNTRRP